MTDQALQTVEAILETGLAIDAAVDAEPRTPPGERVVIILAAISTCVLTGGWIYALGWLFWKLI